MKALARQKTMNPNTDLTSPKSTLKEGIDMIELPLDMTIESEDKSRMVCLVWSDRAVMRGALLMIS